MKFSKLYSEAKSNAISFYDYNPTLSDEIKLIAGVTLGSVYTSLVAKPATLLGGAITAASTALDLITDEEESERTQFLNGHLNALVKQSQLMEETAQTAGVLTNTIYSIGDAIGTFIGAGKFTTNIGSTAIAAGTLQGYADYEKGLAQGLDETTAAEKAVVTGSAFAIGGAIPMTMGIKLTPAAKKIAEAGSRWAKTGIYGKLIAQDVAYTAGANIAVGMGSRGFTHYILKANGYNMMADQYNAFDNEAMLIDGALGIIFGGIAKYAEIKQQRYIDALLAKNNQIHQNTDSSIGVALDVQSMNAHNAAFDKGIKDKIAGKNVDVESILTNSKFAVKKDLNWQNTVTEAITKQYPEDSLYYTKKGTPIPAKVIKEVKQEIISKSKNNLSDKDKLELAKLDNGIIPKEIIPKVAKKIGIQPSEIENNLSIYGNQENIATSDTEFANMLKNAVQDETSPIDVINQILQEKPDMLLHINNEDGTEISARAMDLINSAREEVIQAKEDKKLYEAAVDCLLRKVL